ASRSIASAGAKLSAGSLNIDTTGVTGASVGVPYVGLLGATGGTDPYTWSITNGALPSGFTLDSSTGIISGEHDAPGTFTFTVAASDSSAPTAQTSSASVSLTVSAPPALSITTTG